MKNQPSATPIVFAMLPCENEDGFKYGAYIEFDYQIAKQKQFDELGQMIRDEMQERKITKTFLKNSLKTIKEDFVNELEIVKNSIASNWLNHWCELYLKELQHDK